MPTYSFKYLILLAINLIALKSFAQTRSLRGNAIKDSSKVIQLIIDGTKHKTSKTDSCIYYAQKALQLSHRIKYEAGEALGLNLEGMALSVTGNFPKALEIYLKALEITEKLEDPKYRVAVLINLGDVYAKQEEYRNALIYTFQAKTIAEQQGGNKNLPAILTNIGNSYENLNILDSALIFTNQGYEAAFKAKNNEWLGIALNNLGNIHYKLQHSSIALEYYKTSLPYFRSEEDDEGLSEATLGIAKIFKDQGNFDSSIYYARYSLTLAKEATITKNLLSASTFLYDIFKKQNKVDSAFAYQGMMMAAKDSLFSQEKVKAVQSLSIGESLRQQEIAEEKLKAEEERRNNLQLIAIAAFIFLFTLFVILLGKRKTKSTTINFMITVALLLMFEFISLLVHPYVAHWTHHTPVYMLLILVVVAAVLAPMHHRAEHWIKEMLAHKIIHPKTKKMKVRKVEEQ